jgi:hypothetical protein
VDFMDLPILCSQVDVDDMVLMEIWWGREGECHRSPLCHPSSSPGYGSGEVTVLSFSVESIGFTFKSFIMC